MKMDKPEEAFEKKIKQVARAFPYPQAPKLVVFKKQRRYHAIWVGVLVLLASLLAVPPVRAAVAEFLQIGVIRIYATEASLPLALATKSPVEARPIAATQESDAAFGLDGEMSLEEARAKALFPILLPGEPADLGLPDKVFHLYLDGGEAVLLAWLDPQDSQQVAISLWLLGPGVYAGKGPPERILETSVNNARAVWMEGEHVLLFQIGPGAGIHRFVPRNVLIWETRDVTYRLEGDFSLQEALLIAESLR